MRFFWCIGWALLIMMAVIACILVGALVSAIGLLLPYILPGAVIVMLVWGIFFSPKQGKPPDKQ